MKSAKPLTPRQLQVKTKECFDYVRLNYTKAIEWLDANAKHAIKPEEIAGVAELRLRLGESLDIYDKMVQQLLKGIHQVALQGKDTSIPITLNEMGEVRN